MKDFTKKLITLSLAMLMLFGGLVASIPAQASTMDDYTLDEIYEDLVQEILEEQGEWHPLMVPTILENTGLIIANDTTSEIIAEAWYYDEDGNEVEVDLIEYAEMMNESYQINAEDEALQIMIDLGLYRIPHESVTTRGVGAGISYRFFSITNTSPLGNSSRMTPHFVGPATITVSSSITSSRTFTAGISVAGQNQITSTVNFTAHSSATSAVGGTWSVPRNSTGAVWFQPRFNRAEGTLERRSNGQVMSTRHNVFVRSPRRLNSGHADGIWSLRLS